MWDFYEMTECVGIERYKSEIKTNTSQFIMLKASLRKEKTIF